MDDGAFRCDVNVSLTKPNGQFGPRTELKHLHKFSNIKTAIDYEIQRQRLIIENGGQVQEETRAFDSTTGSTKSMRLKESAADYYFMKDTDIPEQIITKEFINEVEKSLPENLDARIKRLIDLKIPLDVISILCAEPEAVEYFDATYQALESKCEPAKVANWIVMELFGWLTKNHKKILDCDIPPAKLASLLDMVTSEQISARQAKLMFDQISSSPEMKVPDLVALNGWLQTSNEDFIVHYCKIVIEGNAETVAKIRNGKPKLVSYLVGQVMKATGGKANPKIVGQTLNNILFQK
jgi:aspartyl-tRNA(Asn)/glutamyl-tRNA(Gln) amidotransferase subunit B